MSDFTHKLEGMNVIHQLRGVGKIEAVDNQRVKISTGIQGVAPREDNVCNMDVAVLEYLTATDVAMSVQVPVDLFLDQKDWSIAPTSDEFANVEDRITGTKSYMVIPTSNPRFPAREKRKMKSREHQRLKANTLWFDGPFEKTSREMMSCLDFQISYSLLRGDEDVVAYWNRIEGIQDELGRTAWANHVISHIGYGPSFYRMSECLAGVSSWYMHADGMSYDEALSRSMELLEQRMMLFVTPISAFNRNRRKRRLI